jgi:hypothetical protein
VTTHVPFPLEWPVGIARHRRPFRSSFANRTVAVACTELRKELRLFRATHVVISTNIDVTSTGLPRSSAGEPKDRGVAVYFVHRGVSGRDIPYCIALDQYDRVADNVHAIALVISSYRMIERHGGGQLLEQATAGFAALPEAPETKGGNKLSALRALAENEAAAPGERANAQRAIAALERGGSL